MWLAADFHQTGQLPGHPSPGQRRIGHQRPALPLIYASPMVDSGYDIADYRAINPIFGTIDDIDRLIADPQRPGFSMPLLREIGPTGSS
jgi:hypothetical protein